MQLPSRLPLLLCRLAPAGRARELRLERTATLGFTSKRPPGGGCRSSLCRAEEGCHVSDEDCGELRAPRRLGPSPKQGLGCLCKGVVTWRKGRFLRNKRGSFSRRCFCKVSEPSQLSWEDQEFQLHSVDSRGSGEQWEVCS